MLKNNIKTNSVFPNFSKFSKVFGKKGLYTHSLLLGNKTIYQSCFEHGRTIFKKETILEIVNSALSDKLKIVSSDDINKLCTFFVSDVSDFNTSTIKINKNMFDINNDLFKKIINKLNHDRQHAVGDKYKIDSILLLNVGFIYNTFLYKKNLRI